MRTRATALASIAWLAACGGGSGSGGAGVPLSADQQIYQDAEMHGGAASLLWNLPYGGGALVSGVNYISSSSSGGLVQSPAQAGPQLETPVLSSLVAGLDVPYQLPLRYLVSGQIFVRSATALRQVSYVNGEVQVGYLADDGQTLVETAIFHDFTQTVLSGPVSDSPLVVQAAFPFAQWAGANALSPLADWQAGAAYTTRRGQVVGDTYFAADCSNNTANPTTTGTSPTPCLSGAVLEDLFPVTLLDSSGHPMENYAESDGSIVQVQGLRLWIANAPLAADLEPTATYRVFFELDGSVYMGSLWRDATPFGYLQADGSAVAYWLSLNEPATASVQAALTPQNVAAGSAMGTASTVPSVDLFGIGGHAVNGSLAPADLTAQYGAPAGANGAGQVVAIVDAPGTGDVVDDLNVYSQAFGLPPCDAANPCLQVVDLSDGAAVPPQADWGIEVAIDTQMVHAIAPAATILLVTAHSASTADLLAAVNYAAAQPGVVAVNMSFSIYGEPSSSYLSEDQALATFVSTQGLAFFAASGDTGNSWQGAGYPAQSPYVTSVGGTRIVSLAAASAAAAEVAWPYSSGGPSSYAPLPAWQSAALGSTLAAANSQMRAVPDVSAVADYQRSAVAVYYKQSWRMAGGTSVAAPIWAASSALLAQRLASQGQSLAALVRATAGGFNGLLYHNGIVSNGPLRDIVAGGNDLTATPCTICAAVPGYDDVTGLGVPSLGALLAETSW